MLGALMLVSLPIAQAQEDDEAEESEKLGLRATEPTTRNEPSVLVPSESSSSGNYPRPGQPLVTPSPTAAATPRATATPTRAASPKKAASPTPAPAATATPAATKGNVAATIKDLENRWAAAIASHDVSVPQALVANDYIGVDSSGTVVNKSALIAGMRRDKNTYDSAVNSGMTVRVHGNAAVVVGTTKQAGKDAQGKQFNYTYRWTDTWVERNGQWQCVGSQSFLVTR